MRTVQLQRLLAALFKHYRLPVRVSVDGVLGPETRRCIRLAKLAMGWRPKYATGARSLLLYTALRTRGASMAPGQRKRGLAWREQYRHGNSTSAIARRILSHPRARFAFSSPTGGTARGGLDAIAAGEKALVAATGHRTTIALPILHFIEALLNEARGPVFINCIVNARHRDGSTHYVGRAVDIDRSSDAHALERAQLVASRTNVRVLVEDAYHLHIWSGDGP